MGIKLLDSAKKKWKVAFWYKGKHYTRIVYGQRRMAIDVEAKLMAALAEGTHFPDRRRVPFQEIADDYLREYACHLASGDKVAIYVREAARFFDGRDANSITPEDVKNFRALLDKRMTPVSTNHYQRSLRRVFNWAIERGKLRGANPASGKKVKLVNERKYWRTRYLSADEMGRLCAIADPSIVEVSMTAAMTGLRKNELRHLRKRDIDLDKCVVFVFQPKNGIAEYVPFPDTLFPVLKKAVGRTVADDQPVFTFVNFERLWQVARLKAGLEDVHFHDLRHTFASHIVQNTNGNMHTVQKLMRLKDYRLVERYAHLAPSHLRQASLTLDKTFANLAEATAAPQAEPQMNTPSSMPASPTAAATEPTALEIAAMITRTPEVTVNVTSEHS